MNIYKVERTDAIDYDEFDSFVCYAESEEKAKNMIPGHGADKTTQLSRESWTTIENIEVELIGENKSVNEVKIIITSFNAG